MLKPRLIPCLLIKNGGLFKTVKFKEPKYIGDPLNAVKIFNEKHADEIIILDIDASLNNTPPNEKIIGKIARNCRMPLCYGGGIKTIDQIESLISLGVEKVALGSVALSNPNLISEGVNRVGCQSIVGVVDVKKTGIMKRNEVVIYGGNERTGRTPKEFVKHLQSLGVGEVLLNSVDRDGTMLGYDLDLISEIREGLKIPLTVLGGAGSLDDIADLYRLNPFVGAAAGSLFVLKGKYRAVLISYPSFEQQKRLNNCRQNFVQF